MNTGFTIYERKEFVGETWNNNGIPCTPSLTITFHYEKSIERYPYGDRNVEETLIECEPIEYQFMNEPIEYNQLFELFDEYFPDICLNDVIDLLRRKAMRANNLL